MYNLPSNYKCNVAIIGLGYVGLPIAIEIAKNNNCYKTDTPCHRNVMGLDINKSRISELKNGIDKTNEINSDEISIIQRIHLTTDYKEIINADVFIITVPTPIDSAKNPLLTPIKEASVTVGKCIKLRSKLSSKKTIPVIIYESTVYPGLTEEICLPILELESKSIIKKDFLVGYSPERINPGDKNSNISNIIKLTSGIDNETAEWINNFYSTFIKAGTYKTDSIKIAEAAKVIENTQRDINIALVNEIAIICNYLKIDTLDVLKAARTKWNFLDFKPGLVGGHCIGVDPYYLTYKAQILGYHPEILLSGRRINDKIGSWIIDQLIIELIREGKRVDNLDVLLLGVTFKENCPDIRNSGVFQLIKRLKLYGINITAVDPWANLKEFNQYNELPLLRKIPNDKKFMAIIAAVSHTEFELISLEEWQKLGYENTKYIDIKGIIPRELNAIRL
tara:strand:+ start:15196 stop:16545 length:1350 start_codon:yes stop_codon:yes gene_type:complete